MQDYKHIRVGARVFWHDPAINDYPENEREWVRLTIYTIFDIKVNDGEEVNDDTIVCVSSEYGNEGEVYAKELSPAYCRLTEKQRKAFEELRTAFDKCYQTGIKFVYGDYANELMALDGSDIADILWEEDSCDEDFDTIRLENAFDDAILIDAHSLPTCDNNLWIQLKSRSNGN